MRERLARLASAELDRAETTLVAVLLALGEHGLPIEAVTSDGRAHRGTLDAVGDDHVVVAGASGRTVVALAALSTVRSQPGEARPANPRGNRQLRSHRTLAAELSELAAERRWVRAYVRGWPEPIDGEIGTAGVDVLTLVAAAGSARSPGPAVHVAVHSLLALLTGSG